MKKEYFVNRISIVLTILILPLTGCFGPRTPDAANISTIIANPIADSATDAVQENSVSGSASGIINEAGNVVGERFRTPDGFDRIAVEKGSFGEYLRNLPLKPPGSKVRYFDGRVKPREVYEAVIDLDVGDRDLQQCADSIIRLRAEYLYGKGLYNSISFNFTSGFMADYATWMKGKRIKVDGNRAYWINGAAPSSDYQGFRKYLNMVFAYSGTLSLSKEMKSVPVSDMRIGDVFIKGGQPGHCVIVADMAEDKAAGERCFLLAQGYMPAQDMHILKNPANNDGDPWYSVDFGETLQTPEWDFTKDQLMRFE